MRSVVCLRGQSLGSLEGYIVGNFSSNFRLPFFWVFTILQIFHHSPNVKGFRCLKLDGNVTLRTSPGPSYNLSCTVNPVSELFSYWCPLVFYSVRGSYLPGSISPLLFFGSRVIVSRSGTGGISYSGRVSVVPEL